MRRLVIGIAAAFVLAGCRPPATPTPAQTTPTQPSGPVSAWVEFAPDNMLTVRAVTSAPKCPGLEVDGRSVPMDERAPPDAAFPVRVCALSLPRSTRAVTLDGAPLKLPPARIQRIVLFGDTGCRLKGKAVQFCNDPKAWPFAAVATQAAAKHPDLVIHLGDYHYRETPCPAGVAGCAGSPSGDDWDVWWKDLFQPAAPLLKAAPWVMVRGNHELCARAGIGWFKLLDPRSPMPDCADFTAPYAVGLDGLTLAVFDSAESDDAKAVPAQVKAFADALKAISPAIRGPFWLLTHRPIWALDPKNPGDPAHPDFAVRNLTEQAAVDPTAPANMDMAVSGHIHTFSSYDFGGKRPAQLVVGVGGTLTTQMMIEPGSKVDLDHMKTKDAFAVTQWGYLVMDRTATGWNGTLYQAGDDKVLARCAFAGRAVSCR